MHSCTQMAKYHVIKDMFRNIDTLLQLYEFESTSLLFLINTECLSERQHIRLFKLRFDPDGDSTNDFFHTMKESERFSDNVKPKCL